MNGWNYISIKYWKFCAQQGVIGEIFTSANQKGDSIKSLNFQLFIVVTVIYQEFKLGASFL